jgi:hypothetical protein
VALSRFIYERAMPIDAAADAPIDGPIGDVLLACRAA